MRAAALLLFLVCTVACQAQEASADTAPSDQAAAKTFDTHVQPFLQMYCIDCHSGDDAESGVDLDFGETPDVAMAFDSWTKIVEKISGGEMPPEDAEQPSDEERRTVEQWIDAGLANFDCSKQPIVPRTTVRRLNRAEYDNVVRDLVGVKFDSAMHFPADEVGEGFDNLGSVLSLPPLLMEKYLNAAEQITDAIKDDKTAWKKTFPNLPRDRKFDDKRAEQAVGELARRAFRRPVDESDLKRLTGLFQVGRKQGLNHADAMLFVAQGILASPKFLFRLEEDPAAAEREEPTPLDSHAIASRLSFLLWSSMPDEKLTELANKNQLVTSEQVSKQAKRLLRDPKSRAFVENFFGQWLQLRLLTSISPDPKKFPHFSDDLRSDMREETVRYIDDLVKTNGSVLNLLDSGHTFLNARLAEHYGISGVDGEKFQKVKLQDKRRGGVLTHASVLTLTSNPTRTSPVKRGKWILDNILGTPPPPPPPDVPELGEGDELLGSLRERMQQHRENPSCAVCHRKMDALGFGFENFDAIGGWRDRDGRYEIDASGELPDGSTFTNPDGLRKILIASSSDFTNCLTRKLLTYALGRALSSRDKCIVDDIVKHVETHDHQFSELLVAVVTSPAFRFAGHPTGEKP